MLSTILFDLNLCVLISRSEKVSRRSSASESDVTMSSLNYYTPISPESFLLFFMRYCNNDELHENSSNAEMFANEHFEGGDIKSVQETHEEAGGQELVMDVTVGVVKSIVSLALPQVYFDNGELAI